MIRSSRAILALCALGLAACTETVSSKQDPLAKNIIDEAGFGNLLLSGGDPERAVEYFRNASAEEPERADLRRGYAIALTRANRLPEAARIYQELDGLGQAEPTDLLDYAYVAIRLDRWEDAAALEARIPGGLNTARRHLLTAFIADHRQDWTSADAAYGRAEKLTTDPSRILNNWGVSQMSRGELDAAAALFERALSYDSTLFNAKNNLAITRGLRGNYTLPLVPMTDREKAMILNNLGVIAMRRNDLKAAKGLFAAAVEAHPQHYQGAADRLASLEATVGN